jgi:DNA-binding CsgD family transcriptional regulator
MMVQQDLPLAFPASSGTVFINARCLLRSDGERRVVVVAGLCVHSYSVNDAVAHAYAMVFLVDGGFATQAEVARAFGCDERTVRRHQQRYADGGMAALATRSGWRLGRRRIPTRRRQIIGRLKAEGLSNSEIARRLGVTEKAIRKQVGPSERPRQLTLPEAASTVPDEQARSVPETGPTVAPSEAGLVPTEESIASDGAGQDGPRRDSLSLDVDPLDRSLDRLLAAFGYLDDAAPLFGNADAVPGAGVLFAVPVLVASGIFRIAHKLYGEIGPAFYGLRTTLLTLLLMALWRIKRPEALKEHDPQALGRVLGLDRAPEVKTMRRKLTRLAAYGRAERLGAELAQLRVNERGDLMGFLYVDGHVRAYHGKRKLPKAHVARMRLSMPATTDYWVHDAAGDPLFVVTAKANAATTQMLCQLAPDIRKLVGERRVTIVFDRGGWSPKLFLQLIRAGFDILTYRKYKARRIGEHRFRLREATFDGRDVKYRLHDQGARFLKGELRLRQVTRLQDDGHQTQILTSRKDLDDIEVAYRMFHRWRQENFFKYGRDEFLLDALADYQVEPDDPTRTVPNPERKKLDKEIRAQRTEVANLEQAYGKAAVDNPEKRRPTMRGFKIAHGKVGKALRVARERLAELQAKRRGLPKRVEVRDVSEGAVIRLATERKHLTNLIKMLAYQAESDLLAALRPHYQRADDEGRTLLHELFRSPADLRVACGELQVTLRPLSGPHRTQAIDAICETLNETATRFPGSPLQMRFGVHPPREQGLAFPGPRAQPTAPVPPPPPPPGP